MKRFNLSSFLLLAFTLALPSASDAQSPQVLEPSQAHS